MNPVQAAALRSSIRPSSADRAPPVAARLAVSEVAIVGIGFALVCAALAVVMGRDLNWDYFNYHGYAAFDVFGARLSQDYFPAGYQGYLSRIAYLPLALFERAGWSAVAIACGLAAVHSLNLLFLYLIAREFSTSLPRPRVMALVLTLLGAASGAFLLQVGSTFVDPVTTPPVLAALWLSVRWPQPVALFGGAALVGAAAALKLTNVPFAFGFLAACAVRGAGAKGALQLAVGGALAMLAGVVLFYAPWGWRLHMEFGSPLFPLFNGLFRAPDFPTVSVSFDRFVPQTIGQALQLPFAMASHRSWVYSEGVNPDLRPATLVLLAGAALIATFWRMVHGGSAPAASQPDPVTVRFVVVFFGVSCLMWVATSTNGRYAIPLLLLLGPLVFLVARRVAGASAATVMSLALLVLQLYVVYDAGNPRWDRSDWTDRWLPAAVPESLRNSPHLYVATSTSSESYVAAHVHPDSVFTNPIGLISLPSDGPGWARFVALRDRYAGRTKVMFLVPGALDSEGRAQRVAAMNDAADRLGLEIDSSACDLLRFNDAPAAFRVTWRPRPTDATTVRTVYACTASVKTTPSPEMSRRRAVASQIMDGFERKCPKLFAPNGTQVEGTRNVWSRLYGRFDLLLVLDFESGLIHYAMQRQATDTVIGTLTTWRDDVERFTCRLPHGGRRDLSTLRSDASR